MTQDIAYYAARVAGPDWVVPGVCIVMGSEQEAENAFALCTTSVREGRLPPSEVEFEYVSGEGFIFRMRAQGREGVFHVEAAYVPDIEIRALRELMLASLYFFVIFGWTSAPEGTIELLDPTEHALFKTELTIAGSHVVGTRGVAEIPWSRVLSGDFSVLLGTYLDSQPA